MAAISSPPQTSWISSIVSPDVASTLRLERLPTGVCVNENVLVSGIVGVGTSVNVDSQKGQLLLDSSTKSEFMLQKNYCIA